MSLLDRRTLLLMPLALAACGFTPAYGPGSAASTMLDGVWVANPSTKAAFDFVERMEERLGRPERRLYDLDYEIETRTIGVGITADQRITRYNLTGIVTYRLTRADTDEVLAKGSVNSFTAYAATGSTVAGLAAEEDAGLRLMRILADQVVAQLVAQMSARQARTQTTSQGG